MAENELRSSGTLHMVQVTTGTTHGFNFKYVKLLIDKLEDGQVFTVTNIRIFSIVPECIRRVFKIKLTKEDRSGFTEDVEATLKRFGWTGSVDLLVARFEILGLPAWDQNRWAE